ncbi:hypothetical protein ASPWEDRAFT_448938 [Aspergillus wentii DTO 134E9]|uniref:Helicase C-terminal domain-containing protein n=1 Tax=Aspergillus wentii DTO 134E9 TaxID=1073089 RepID=A0A1L9RQW3_ASPWE|nr:uncharacterized protein ASPWEDRAFT_448938 [Aspergillus wentii DTO 134E9]OJJ37321.1 hypothetical protein ASPWEDRAFT_448938 [Aspergillus wentii DTO 134E9]
MWGSHPVLDDFVRTAKTVNSMADKVHNYASRPDKGFAFLWAHVNSDRKACIPPAQASTAYWLAADCIKLRYVLKIFFDEGLFNQDPNAPRPRFLLFVHWPLILWYVELFLSNIGVEFEVIRSSMTDMERTAAASRFVDPKLNVKILLTTFACGAQGLNLHTTCSRVIIIEPALNLSTVFQGAHRVHRMGQKERQKIWILFGEHTVSRWIEANSARKAMPQVASDISHYLQPLIESGRKRREAAGQADSIQAEDELINIETTKHMCAILGQRRSRLHMGELTDLGYDDSLNVMETKNKRKATSDDSKRDSKKPNTTSSLAVINVSFPFPLYLSVRCQWISYC